MRLRRPLPAVQGDTLHIVGVGDNRIGKDHPSDHAIKRIGRAPDLVPDWEYRSSRISECPSGDFMSRMNRLSGAPLEELNQL